MIINMDQTTSFGHTRAAERCEVDIKKPPLHMSEVWRSPVWTVVTGRACVTLWGFEGEQERITPGVSLSHRSLVLSQKLRAGPIICSRRYAASTSCFLSSHCRMPPRETCQSPAAETESVRKLQSCSRGFTCTWGSTWLALCYKPG